MIKYLKHNEIDKIKWDESINRAYNGLIYAYSWYLDLVSPDWHALVKDDYTQVFPLTWRRKSGISYLFQPPFTQQLGVFSTEHLSGKDIRHFIDSIPAKFKFAEINLNIFNKVDEINEKVRPQLTHELDLIESYERIQQAYSDNLLRNIKKARNAGLYIKADVEPSDIIKLFRLNKGNDISTLGENDYQILHVVIKKCLEKQIGVSMGVYNADNKLYAGAFFVASHSKVIFLFSATASEARNTGALHYLIDYFIYENAQRNLTLDFEGSNNKDLARFYKSYGAKECVYHLLIKNELPWLISKGVDVIKMLKKS